MSAANAGLLAGQALQSISISTHVLSVLHDRIISCEFHVFHDKLEDCVSVICLKVDGDHPRDLLNLTDLRDRRAHLVPLGSATSAVQVRKCIFILKKGLECDNSFSSIYWDAVGIMILICQLVLQKMKARQIIKIIIFRPRCCQRNY